MLLVGAAGFHHWAYLQLQPAPMPALAPAPPTTLSADSCAACHVEIYEEWAASRMSVARTDAVFATDFEAEGSPFICLRCHAPLAEQQPQVDYSLLWFKPLIPLARTNPDHDPALEAQGVTCTACHLTEGGIKGRGIAEAAPHPVVTTDIATLNEGCARCHQLDAPPLSNLVRPISDTVEEWRRWQEITGRKTQCTECHMPEVERPLVSGYPARTSHRHHFPGAWNDAYAASGLRITTPTRTAHGVEVTLENLAGHNLPSGEPARAVLVEVLGRGEPVLEVIGREVHGYRDVRDTSLRPGETRTLTLPYEADGTVDLVISFDRLHFLPELHDVAPNHRIELARYRLEGS